MIRSLSPATKQGIGCVLMLISTAVMVTAFLGVLNVNDIKAFLNIVLMPIFLFLLFGLGFGLLIKGVDEQEKKGSDTPHE